MLFCRRIWHKLYLYLAQSVFIWYILCNSPAGGYSCQCSLLIKVTMILILWEIVLFQASQTLHYSDVIMSTMASQITSLKIVYTTVYSGTDQRKHQSSPSLVFVRGIHWSPANSSHSGPVMRRMFPFDDVIMIHFYTFDSLGLSDGVTYIDHTWLR